MDKVRKSIGIYVLSASLIFLGISVLSSRNSSNSEQNVAALNQKVDDLTQLVNRLRNCTPPIQGFTNGAFVNGTVNLTFC